MINIGIIAGDGKLPVIIGKNLSLKKYNITYFLINNNKEDYSNFNTVRIKNFSIKEILNILNKNKIDKLILAGNIKRPSLSEISLDFETMIIVKKLFLEKKGDDQLLNSIQKYFEDKGFKFFDWRKYCKEIFANEELLTIKKPSKNALMNLTKAKEVFKIFGKGDIGQSLIVQNQLILGLEAIEGTDKLIERCFNYKKNEDQGVLVKFNKYEQSSLLDIPTIGLNTIILLNKYNYEGLFVEKNKCIILDKEKVKDFADDNNIFISAVNKIE